MQETFDLTTLIFIGLAIFVAWRLRSVLGQKTGHEKPPLDMARRDRPALPREENGPDNVVRLPGSERPAVPAGPDRWKDLAEPDSEIAKGLDAIAGAEPDFDARQFVDGAKMAYEMIVSAFAAGDRKTLKPLLSREVYEGFEREITRREKEGETVETTFVSIDRARLSGVELRGRVAQITVDFASKLITATRDGQGKVIDGNPEAVIDVNDIWTFARTLGTRDPNWQLVATEAGE